MDLNVLHMKKSKLNKKINILKSITPDESLNILNILAREDVKIAKRIEQIALSDLKEVNIDSIASDLYSELESIDVEDLWDRSGNTAHGYVDPGEEAITMFEEALDPFKEDLKRYQELKMFSEAKDYCKGILLGIYKFEKEAKTKFKDWAVDAPEEYFSMILDDWKKSCKNRKFIEEMELFLKEHCPDR